MRGLDLAVLWAVAERPQTYVELANHLLGERPRMWVGAVGCAICRLNTAGLIELHGVHWRAARRGKCGTDTTR